MAKRTKKSMDPSAEGVLASQKMSRKDFEKELSKLQVELTRLQAWAVAEGARVIVVFEGRDTAGKGGVISRIMQRCTAADGASARPGCSPRGAGAGLRVTFSRSHWNTT